MAKQVSTYVRPKTKQRLDKHARDVHRSVASVIRLAILEYLDAHAPVPHTEAEKGVGPIREEVRT